MHWWVCTPTTPATAQINKVSKVNWWWCGGRFRPLLERENCCYPNCKYLLVCFSGHKKELCYWPFIVEAYESEVDGERATMERSSLSHRKCFDGRAQKTLKLLNARQKTSSHAQKLRCEHFMVILACMMHGTVLHVQQAGTFNIVDTRFAFFRWKHVLAIKNIEANDAVFVSLKRRIRFFKLLLFKLNWFVNLLVFN